VALCKYQRTHWRKKIRFQKIQKWLKDYFPPAVYTDGQKRGVESIKGRVLRRVKELSIFKKEKEEVRGFM